MNIWEYLAVCLAKRSCPSILGVFLQTTNWWVGNFTLRLTECSRQLFGDGEWYKNELAEENRPRLARRDKTTGTNRGRNRKRERTRQRTMGRGGRGAPWGGGGLPSFSSVWWSLDGFLLPDLHLPSRLKKFSSSSLPYSGPAAPPSDNFTALVNLT